MSSPYHLGLIVMCNLYCMQVTWASVSTYSSDVPATADVYTSSVPTVFLGILRGSSELASLWAHFPTGEVFSAEWVAGSTAPVGFLYNPGAEQCWQAAYSSTSGYGAWEQSSAGPLRTSCTAVSSAAWYTRASSMSGGATYTGAGPISSGYIGIERMVHQATANVVLGGEMDGRTVGAELTKGKPEQGEAYLVSTSNSAQTLVASTESSVQAQLYSSSAVNPSSVGGLTGNSAQALESQLGTFGSIWSNSESVSSAEAQGLVSQRCPSETSAAYIALPGQESALVAQQQSSLQRLNTSSLQLVMVPFLFS